MLVSVYMWNQAPFATLLFLAGMQSISEDLYAAAEVDGAGYWQRFRYVTLPALRPILFLVLVLCTVNGFLMLDLIYILTMGGPALRHHHDLLARLPDQLRRSSSSAPGPRSSTR